MKHAKSDPMQKETKRYVNKVNIDLAKTDMARIIDSINTRRKDAVLNMRVNSKDLKSIKDKSKRLGIKYQTFLSELIHRVARG